MSDAPPSGYDPIADPFGDRLPPADEAPPAGPPSGPPSGPPTGPPSGPPAAPPTAGSGDGGRRMGVTIAIVLVAIAALIGLGLALTGGDDKKDDTASHSDDAAEEVFLEPVSYTQDPFTPSVAETSTGSTTTTASTTTAPTTTAGSSTTAERTAIQQHRGGTPGLYGGTRDLASCDKDQLVEFLEANPDKGEAWASTLGIERSEIRSYVATLTSVVLRSDTRVTNHGFRNGRATSIQAVLQAGTAVLVDEYGRPVTKCACGNPLTDPVASKARYSGDPWPAFNPASITVVVQNTVVVQTFVLVDTRTGDPFERPAASDGIDDEDFEGDLPPMDDEPGGQFDPCAGEDPDPELCIDDSTTTTSPPPPDNDLLSGTYSFTATVTGGSSCTAANGQLTVVVSGEGAGRTVTFTGSGNSTTGAVDEDLAFNTSGGNETFEGRFFVDGTAVTIEGTDNVGSGRCIFQVSGTKG